MSDPLYIRIVKRERRLKRALAIWLHVGFLILVLHAIEESYQSGLLGTLIGE
jgi:hypothetical protein